MSQSTPQLRKTCFELRAAMEELGLNQVNLARLCGVKPVQVWRWCEGKAEVPVYVWTILSLLGNADPLDVMYGEVLSWPVLREHVFRRGKNYRALAKRFHPDVTGRDTTPEMQIINSMRK